MRSLLYIGILLGGVSCAESRPAIQSGDLLFQAGERGGMAGAIVDATGTDRDVNFTHVGIAIIAEGADSVLEASSAGGVRMVALNDFLDGAARIDGRPAVVAMRLRDTAGVAAAIKKSRTFVGQPYDYYYLPNNGRMYCSELVWESFLKPDEEPIFTAHAMNFRAADGEMPQFWVDLFRELGEEVPEGMSGTNPNDMSQEEILTEVYRWF